MCVMRYVTGNVSNCQLNIQKYLRVIGKSVGVNNLDETLAVQCQFSHVEISKDFWVDKHFISIHEVNSKKQILS